MREPPAHPDPSPPPTGHPTRLWTAFRGTPGPGSLSHPSRRIRTPVRWVREVPMAVLDVPAVDDLSGRPTEWLADEITTVAGQLAAATCRFLLLLAEFDRREGYHRWECNSCAHWLGWKVGMSRRTAQDHVRVARALEDLPITTKAFAAGQLSYSKVRAITRVATPKSEGS